MKLYAYCLTDGSVGNPPTFFSSITGISGAVPYALEFRGISAIVSDFAGDTVSITKENVFAHQRVVGHMLSQVTPLPFRFGALISESQLRSHIESHRGSIETTLSKVQGCVEMGVKIIGRSAITEQSSESAASLAEDSSIGPGTRFLLTKRAELEGAQTL
jgi:hypothetical protein